MDHAAGVGVGHRLRDRLEDRQEPGQVVGRARAGREQVGQRLALDQLHGEERPAVGEGAQLVDRHDARVLQLAADLRLLDEPADQVGVVAEVLAEDLDGHVAAEVGVAALEHGAHAAAGDLAVDPVAESRCRRRSRAGRSARAPRRGRVAEQDAGHGADRRADRVEHRTRPERQVERVAGLGSGPGSGTSRCPALTKRAAGKGRWQSSAPQSGHVAIAMTRSPSRGDPWV